MDGNDNQRWTWVGDSKNADKGRRIRSKSSGLVLDVEPDGRVVQRNADESAKSQLWRVVEIDE